MANCANPRIRESANPRIREPSFRPACSVCAYFKQDPAPLSAVSGFLSCFPRTSVGSLQGGHPMAALPLLMLLGTSGSLGLVANDCPQPRRPAPRSRRSLLRFFLAEVGGEGGRRWQFADWTHSRGRGRMTAHSGLAPWWQVPEAPGTCLPLVGIRVRRVKPPAPALAQAQSPRGRPGTCGQARLGVRVSEPQALGEKPSQETTPHPAPLQLGDTPPPPSRPLWAAAPLPAFAPSERTRPFGPRVGAPARLGPLLEWHPPRRPSAVPSCPVATPAPWPGAALASIPRCRNRASAERGERLSRGRQARQGDLGGQAAFAGRQGCVACRPKPTPTR